MLIVGGVGPGNPKYLTLDVRDRILEVDNIIAFGRIGKTIQDLGKKYIEVSRVDEILSLIDDKEDWLLLASGDPNFFGIVEYLQKSGIAVGEVLPGLSSFQYLMAKLKKPWQEGAFISLHGREEDLSRFLDKGLLIALVDKKKNPSYISKKLSELGRQGTIYVGFNLSYQDEKIIKVRIGEEIEDYSSLGVVVIENEMA